MKRFILITLTIMAAQYLAAQDPFQKIEAKKEVYQRLSLSAIKPTGWLEAQMKKDLDGFVGNLDKLVPDLIVKDDIYGKNRLTKKVKSKDLGNNPEGKEWEVQYLWWNSETQSNWWDGYIRNAYYTNDKKHIARVEEYIKRVLSTQDKDGYIGIYEPDLRYNFSGENGELWAKASMYRTLLAYYEFTGDKKVLQAVERAIQNVMDNYKINASTPFYAESSSAGLWHGLVFTDVLDRLHQLTGNSTYWDYALFLYKDYSSHELPEKDIQYPSIMDPEYKLFGHGVHTYEHIRPLTVATYASGNPALEKALRIYLQRIQEVTTCTGGAIGDEWIVKRKAHPTYTGYEYCSLHELLDSYAQLLQKSGDIQLADEIENIFFNAAMGARHPERSTIAYLKTDNSFEMTGSCNGLHEEKQTRYKYSPAHQDVAVCCVPNAGRITPYYVQNMWLKGNNELIASLLGSCEVTTEMNGNLVNIKEVSSYPSENRIQFEIETKQPVSFVLKIRKPSWAKSFNTDANYTDDKNFIIIDKTWSGKSTFTVDFKSEIQKHFFTNEVYFTDGPTVLALAIEAEEIPKREYIKGFQDYEYAPKNRIKYLYNNKLPVKKGNEYSVELFNPATQKAENKVLVPIGNSVLRQVTFGIQ